MIDSSEALSRARSLLASKEPSPLLVRRRDDAECVAFLAELKDGFVIPLTTGRNFIGGTKSSVFEWPRRIFEAATWFIEIEDGKARIADASSTNGSTIITATGKERLVHPNEGPVESRGLKWRPLNQGDVLVGIYSSVVFGIFSAR